MGVWSSPWVDFVDGLQEEDEDFEPNFLYRVDGLLWRFHFPKGFTHQKKSVKNGEIYMKMYYILRGFWKYSPEFLG